MNQFARAIWATGLYFMVVGMAGCAHSRLPDPKEAASEYSIAAAKGDADALYAMMATSAKKDLSLDEVRAIVRIERAELSAQARALSANDTRVEATAILRFDDGEETALDWERGSFFVTSAGTLPAGGKTPDQPLDHFRPLLPRPSY